MTEGLLEFLVFIPVVRYSLHRESMYNYRHTFKKNYIANITVAITWENAMFFYTRFKFPFDNLLGTLVNSNDFKPIKIGILIQSLYYEPTYQGVEGLAGCPPAALNSSVCLSKVLLFSKLLSIHSWNPQMGQEKRCPNPSSSIFQIISSVVFCIAFWINLHWKAGSVNLLLLKVNL